MILIPFLLLTSLGILWGSGYVIARFAVTHGVPAFGYAFWQSLGPAILLTLFALKNYSKEMTLRSAPWHFYLICGLVGVAIPNSTMYFAARHIPAGMLAIIVNTAPIFIYPLALLCKQESFRWYRLLAVAVGFIGILLLVLRYAAIPNDPFGLWPTLALVAPLMFALCTIYIGTQKNVPSSALVSAAGMMIMSSILLMPMVLATHSFYSLWPPFSVAGWLVILEILLSSLGYVIFFRLIQMAGPVYYSMVGGVVGVTGLFWGWLIFGEHPTYTAWLAIGLIIIAIILLAIKRKQNR
ncbi:MAG: DMT family transporter [Gammaproteobacteria bacterium]|nr:DMT family transporter [Gammaproteobacteria bacterium]